MNIYRRKSAWKILLTVAALLVVGISLWYSNRLAAQIAEREEKEAEMWAKAYKSIFQADDDTDLSFELEMIRENESVPAILADDRDSILATRNIDAGKGDAYLQQRLKKMKSKQTPIEMDINPGIKHYIYYEESIYIKRLRFYPVVQLGIIAAFIAIGYLLFSTAKTAEQNQLWVGMAKETAHQLGTPLTSLEAWLELLREKKNDAETDEILNDIGADIDRLELVAERFSKIGSAPELKEAPLKPLLEKSLEYIRKRSSEKMKLELKAIGDPKAKFSPPLFEWVIENLLKNALDAMSGIGSITITLSDNAENVTVEVTDSGKGIPKGDYNTVFQPGFSTKKRGWGLGLALSKRIIEEYHQGKIFVKESSTAGTTFRILLPKKS